MDRRRSAPGCGRACPRDPRVRTASGGGPRHLDYPPVLPYGSEVGGVSRSFRGRRIRGSSSVCSQNDQNEMDESFMPHGMRIPPRPPRHHQPPHAPTNRGRGRIATGPRLRYGRGSTSMTGTPSRRTRRSTGSARSECGSRCCTCWLYRLKGRWVSCSLAKPRFSRPSGLPAQRGV